MHYLKNVVYYFTMDMSIITLDIFVYVLAVIVVLLVIWIILLERKLRRFMTGKNAKNLESSIMNIKMGQESQREINKEIGIHMKDIDRRTKGSIRGLSTIRFNAFEGDGGGGKMSFATALLNEKNDGVIISTLCGRDRFSVFAKPIEHGNSEFELSDEERKVLKEAQQSLK